MKKKKKNGKRATYKRLLLAIAILDLIGFIVDMISKIIDIILKLK